jgi:ABC-type arginine transport system permease subunit
MKIVQLMTMTANEWFWRLFFWIVVAAVVILAITAVFDKIADNIDRKREMERRACKRSGAPIRPTRRY